MKLLKNTNWLLLSTVALEGFISLGVEILAIRQMIPYVGSNTLNTSIIIGIFLLFLSFGYYKGGQVKENKEITLFNNLFYSTALIAIGLSSTFLILFFNLFTSIGNLYGLIAFSMIIIAPTVFLLGQTIPIVTNFMKDTSLAAISGKLMFLSTLGSFMGSILTSVVLLNYLGVHLTLVFYITILCVLLTVLYRHVEINKFKVAVKVIVLAVLIGLFNSQPNYLYANQYSSVNIAEKENGDRHININHSYSSGVNTGATSSVYEYINEIAFNIEHFSKENKIEVLVLGAGGFTLSLKDNKNTYTYVDIDGDLKEYSENYLLKKKIKHKFIKEDARYYLSRTSKKYDVIVLDAFSNILSIPPFLITQEFFKGISEHLTTNGTLMINFIGDPFFKDAYSSHFNQTVSSIYNCGAKVLQKQEIGNIVYICSVKKDNIVYTDNKINLMELL